MRKYDTELGRFLSVDPLWEIQPGHSPYHYAYNDPINGSDGSGMFTQTTLSGFFTDRDGNRWWYQEGVSDAMNPGWYRRERLGSFSDWLGSGVGGFMSLMANYSTAQRQAGGKTGGGKNLEDSDSDNSAESWITRDETGIADRFMSSNLQEKVDMTLRLRDPYAMTYKIPEGGEYGFLLTSIGSVYNKVGYPPLSFPFPPYLRILAIYHTHPSTEDGHSNMFSAIDVIKGFSNFPNGAISILEVSGLTYVLSMDNQEKVADWKSQFVRWASDISDDHVAANMQDDWYAYAKQTPSRRLTQASMEKAMARLLEGSGMSLYRKSTNRLVKINY